MLLLPLIFVFMLTFRHGFSVPDLKKLESRDGHGNASSLGPGSPFVFAEQIGVNGLAFRMTTLAGEIQCFYKYNEQNLTTPSITNYDGIVYTNGTETIITMRKCPDNPSGLDSIYIIISGIAPSSSIEWESHDAGLPSICGGGTNSNDTTTPATTPTPVNTQGEGSGNDIKQHGVIILTLMWSTVVCISYRSYYSSPY